MLRVTLHYLGENKYSWAFMQLPHVCRDDHIGLGISFVRGLMVCQAPSRLIPSCFLACSHSSNDYKWIPPSIIAGGRMDSEWTNSIGPESNLKAIFVL
jgi:hypothetical protein